VDGEHGGFPATLCEINELMRSRPPASRVIKPRFSSVAMTSVIEARLTSA